MNANSALVTGSLYRSNGQQSGFFLNLGGKWGSEFGQVEYELTILKGHFSLELKNGFSGGGSDDAIFVLARQIMDAAVLGLVAVYGWGIFVVIEDCRKPDNLMCQPVPDRSPSIGIEIGTDEAVMILNPNQSLRFAVRDFNSGLIDRENCPVLFFRCIESLVRVFTNEDEIKAREWEMFHQKIGTEEVQKIELMNLKRDFFDKHRHGNRVPFQAADHARMMKIAKYFVLKTMHNLKNSPASQSTPM